MSTTADQSAPPSGKKSALVPLIVGLVLALAGAGGGFMAVRLGFFSFENSAEHGAEESEDSAHEEVPSAAFVALEPLIINLPDPSGRRFLRFSAQLEVAPEHLADVEAIKPRIIDVLNGYLRAVEVSDLEDPAALIKLRSQMLRRVQVVAGQGLVRDLLVMEFIVN